MQRFIGAKAAPGPCTGRTLGVACARQARDSQLIQYATEIRVRAERRAGEMLAQTEKRTGGDAMKARYRADIELAPPTLAQMGITMEPNSCWQQLALRRCGS